MSSRYTPSKDRARTSRNPIPEYDEYIDDWDMILDLGFQLARALGAIFKRFRESRRSVLEAKSTDVRR